MPVWQTPVAVFNATQGSVLCHILFLLYTAEISDVITGCRIADSQQGSFREGMRENAVPNVKN